MATPGYIVGSECIPAASAQDAWFSAQPAAWWVEAGNLYRSVFEHDGSVWHHNVYDYTAAPSLLSSVVAQSPALPGCDYTEPFFDGVSVGWGIAATFIAVAALKQIKIGAR